MHVLRNFTKCLAILLILLTSCKKEEPPVEVKLTDFGIKEFPELDFTFDYSTDPITITNTVLLPAGTDISSLTPEFELSATVGTVLSDREEISSGATELDFSDEVFIKTINTEGEIDNYYEIVLLVEELDAPKISNLVFTLNPYDKTPLAGLVEFETDRACTLELTVKGQDDNDLSKKFKTPATSFSVPVLGLYPNATNHIILTITDQDGLVSQEGIYANTDPLPAIYPEIELLESDPGAMEEGFIFLYLKRYKDGLANGTQPLASMVDAFGKVRWIFLGDFNAPFKRLANGNWIVTRSGEIYEMDMLGNPTGKEWQIPHIHHDLVELPDGNFLALTEEENSVEDVVVEIDRQSGNLVREWDFKDILAPERPVCPYHPNSQDWLHLNGIDYDPLDDAFLVSGRNQSAVVKIDRQTSEIIWILGNHEKWPEEFHKYLLTPVGKDFEWQWGQHAPMLHASDNSRLILFDNGNERSYENPLLPTENYSRGVEFQIDEQKMEVRQLWQYGKERGRELYCPYISDANYLYQTDNRLICFGGITRDINGNASEIFNWDTGALVKVKNYAHIIEVAHSGNVLFEIRIADDSPSFAGYRSYRANKLSLYPEAVE
jgi:hypothetical protein